jgi:hypothetical protein
MLGMWLFMSLFTVLGWLLFRAQNSATVEAFVDSMFLIQYSSERTWPK